MSGVSSWMIAPRHVPLSEYWPGSRWLLWWWLLLFGWFCGLLLCGCRTDHTAMHEPLVELHQDTVYRHHRQQDSVFVFRNVEWDYRRAETDTLIIRETTVEHHYQWIRDTLYRLQRDSIPYAVPVIEEHEVRYVPGYAKLLSAIGLLALIYLFFRGKR